MRADVEEALRYLGAAGAQGEVRRWVEAAVDRLDREIRPRWVWRVFPLRRNDSPEVGAVWCLEGSELCLTGHTAGTMLQTCDAAAVLVCTLGAAFDRLSLRTQRQDMAQAAVLDACGSALVEAACGAAEAELARRLPDRYLTDRFSPGYGDLPLDLQPALLRAADAQRRVGVTLTESAMMVPQKSVSALVGLSGEPQRARVRGCAHCSLRSGCAMRKRGETCAL